VYKPVNVRVNFPKLEEEILEFWEKNDIFQKSLKMRKDQPGAKEFVFYDGPPFATGLPHFGHFVPNTIKDIIPRYQCMKGRIVERRFGWDCHGLPVENLIEKELGLNSKTAIEEFGIAKFNEACRASVLRYVQEWRQTITRLGRWVDFDNDYKTMEPDYMETIWWVMKMLWDKGLLYEGHYILPYCPRCATVLSNHELNLGGYKDVHDPAITVRFKIKNEKDIPPNSYFLAWTTTPWTLPSNLALTVGADIDYVLIEDLSASCNYILAEARLPVYYKTETGNAANQEVNNQYKIIWHKKGEELLGLQYEPLLPYFKDTPNAFRIFLGDFVTTEDGTGIVHTAPGFGEDDARVLKGSGIPVICPVDAECRFTEEVTDFSGLYVKDADKGIIEKLKQEGKLVKRDQLLHAYPHCWRCSSPLIYRAVGSWFVSVEKIKNDMLEANSQIYWMPEHIKEGRFGKWLEGARDWAISRSRYWGNPLPIWRCDECGKTICIGSREELEKLSGVYPQDLHKHYVDEITIPCCKNGGSCCGKMIRVPEVLDCWFESGAMPYAQSHYPFKNKEFFDSHFPSDFISEGLDQTRGWFYTLTVLAAALFKKPAFKTCVVNGLVLAADGKKMSKSLRNYTDPNEVINLFGADALRLFLVHSAVVKADDLRYSDDGVREVMKSLIIPLWNAYSFFVTYANIDNVTPASAPEKCVNPLDQWILSETQTLIEKTGGALDSCDLSRAIDPILKFIDLLNNWYIRRSRRRFWRSAGADGENDSDKLEAYGTLYEALKTLITVSAPFMPFITDAIWQNLRKDNDPESVHLCDFPDVNEKRRDKALEFRMASVMSAVSIGRSLRSQYNIKMRQPLRKAELVTRNQEEKKSLIEMSDIIREELNVKELVFSENEEDLIEYEVKANFRILGKELGKDMKAAAAKIEKLSHSEIQSVMEGASLSIDISCEDGSVKPLEITAEKLDIRRNEKASLRVLNEGTLTIGLDTEITRELSMEGDIRDLIRGIQNTRKEIGLSVTDRIELFVHGSESLKEAWDCFKETVAEETLAPKAEWVKTDGQISLGTAAEPDSKAGKGSPLADGEDTWFVKIQKI